MQDGSREAAPTEPAENDRLLLAEANHRIANNLALIVGLLQMHATEMRRRPGPVSAGEVAGVLDGLGSRVQTVAALHRLLSTGPLSEEVDIAAYLREVCDTLATALSFHGAIDLSGLVPGCVVPAIRATPLALIVGELVTNAIKHAHPTGVAGKLAIAARCTDDGTVLIEVHDDGVGLPEGLDPLAEGGTGLRLVRTLGEQLCGSLEFVSGAIGLRVSMQVPPA